VSRPSILIGAVAYDPRVVTIWEGIRNYLRVSGLDADFALFSNYERQVQELLAGHIDVAWDTPLAHVRVQKAAQGATHSLAMRDSDRDFKSQLVARSDAGISTPADLAGKTLAVGSRDSTQARILPLHFLAEAGVDLSKVQLLAFDTDLGKHGDTGTSELDVLAAVAKGDAQAGTVGDLIWAQETSAGRVDGSRVRAIWTSPPFDHCMFDARPGLDAETRKAFAEALFLMSYENAAHRRILDLEGLRKWMPPRETGYAGLIQALDRFALW